MKKYFVVYNNGHQCVKSFEDNKEANIFLNSLKLSPEALKGIMVIYGEHCTLGTREVVTEVVITSPVYPKIY